MSTMTPMTLAETVARLEAATNRLAGARQALLTAELAALDARAALETAEAALATATLRAQADAPGTNETQRKAHALAATEAGRLDAARARGGVLEAEKALAGCKAELRLADDERRTAEALVGLWQTGVLPAPASSVPYPADGPDIPF